MKKERTNHMETYETVKEVPEAPAPKKKRGAWKAVVAAVLIAGVAGSTTVSVFNLVTLKSYIAKVEKEKNPETTEDYVKIAENSYCRASCSSKHLLSCEPACGKYHIRM